MSKSLHVFPGPLAAPAGSPGRRALAMVLIAGSRSLARLARRLHVARVRHPSGHAPALEFYADAGAPEGALYVDGEYVGVLPGVRRL